MKLTTIFGTLACLLTAGSLATVGSLMTSGSWAFAGERGGSDGGRGGRGTQSGGGGGNVHDTFILGGNRVMQYLRRPEGQKIVAKYNLNLCRLDQTLNEDLVFVYDGKPMVDHRGSRVDAYTYRWRIHLDKKEWEHHFETGADIFYLIFKEMLRSEGTYFDQAIEISQTLRPFPRDLFLDKTGDSNIIYNPDTCLNDDDREKIKMIRLQNRLYDASALPQCVDTDLPHNTKESPADQFLDLAKRTQCEIAASRCGEKEEPQVINVPTVGVMEVVFRNVYWKGQVIFKVPLSGRDKNGELYDLNSVRAMDDLEFKLAELEHYGICTPTPGRSLRKVSASPDEGLIRDQFGQLGFENMFNFVYLNRGIENGPIQMCDSDCMKQKYVGLLGEGSRVQILDRKVYFNDGRASFIKIRVLDNTISKIVEPQGTMVFSNGAPSFTPYRNQSLPIAAPGNEGYVMMSNTSFFKNFDPHAKVIRPK